MTSPASRFVLTASFSVLLAAAVSAQEGAPPAPAPVPTREQPEEIVVTGSYIKGTPEDAALPVDVTSLSDLQDQGAPSVAELVRNLAYTSGNLAETNQFNAGGAGQAQEGVLTVNLRGLGSARTLVLVNGHRLAPSDVVGSDLSILPKSAIGRLEVLKDGAAALYGSDAIGGVANFITRENFEGFEISGSEQFIDKSDGDHEVSLLGGWGNDRLHIIGAFEWSHRSRLPFRDRDWGLIPEPANPQGGWSSIANPARVLQASPGGTILSAGFPDPNCALLGGAVSGPSCRFQYTYFDNLTEEQDNYKIYTEANYDLTDTMELHLDFLWGLMDMPHWNSSPSYPPQSLFGPDRFIPASHPGLIDFKAQNPALFPDLFGIPGAAQGVYALNRALGVTGREGGKPLVAARRTDQWRVSTSLSGEISSIDYELAFTYAFRERFLDGQDMFVERMAFALDGLGGPGCTPSTGTPGVGPCMYYNPFSNAIQRSAVNGATNPQFNPAVANDPDLIKWLFGNSRSWTTNKLYVIDGVVSGEVPWWSLPGGEIGWAAGFQVRGEKYDLSVLDQTNLDINPCPFNDPFSTNPALGNGVVGNITQAAFDACQNGQTTPTGPYAFLAGTYEQYFKRTIYGFFGELSLPFHETFDAQLAVRFENYGGQTGSTTDPKLALRWQPLDWLTLRGSVSTTFRGPPQSFLANRITALAFIAAANAFKAVDTVGNPKLKPESALTSNVGIVFQWEGLYASLDYWRFKFEDPFQTENYNQIVTRYDNPSATNPLGLGCQNGGVGELTPECQSLRSQIFPLGTTAALLERVDVLIRNGSEINTSGLDFYVQYEFDDLLGGTLAVGSTGSYRIEYDSDDFFNRNGVLLAPGGDFNGQINDGNSPFTPLPALKTDVFTKFTRGIHTASIIGHYVTDYIDVIPPLPSLGRIDNFFTVDMHYVVRLFDESTALSFSIMNLSDEDPPLAGTDLNYDPLTHEGRGRMFKIGLTYTWTPE